MRRFIFSVGLFFLCSNIVRAESPVDSDDLLEAVDLPRLRVLALARNPEIRAMEQRWRGAEARPPQQGALPDPSLNIGYHNEGFKRLRQGSSDFSWFRFGAEQELPFPGKLGLREAVAQREADRQAEIHRATVLDVLTRLRLAYDDYFLASKSIEVVGSNHAVLKKLAQSAEARYTVGQGLQQDLVRAEVELSILTGRLLGLEQERESAAAAINALLSRDPVKPLGKPKDLEKQPLQYEIEGLVSAARDRSPDLNVARIEIDRAETNLSLAKRAYYPDFILRADYFNKSSLVPEWEVGAGIRLPLYFWEKQAHGVEEAAAGLEEARALRENATRSIVARLKDLHAQASSSDRLVELYGKGVVPQAEVSLSSASAGYQVGKVDFLTLLNNFTVLNEYQLRYYEELTRFDKALAQLEEVAGLLDEKPSETAPH